MELFREIPLDRPLSSAVRSGSYGLNLYLFRTPKSFYLTPYPYYDLSDLGRFEAESRVQYPSQTPVLGDAITWSNYPPERGPRRTENPPTWAYGSEPWRNIQDVMDYWAVPRHGSRPSRLPMFWGPISQRVPGAINVGMFDGHVEPVPIERLWNMYWFRDFKPHSKWGD